MNVGDPVTWTWWLSNVSSISALGFKMQTKSVRRALKDCSGKRRDFNVQSVGHNPDTFDPKSFPLMQLVKI